MLKIDRSVGSYVAIQFFGKYIPFILDILPLPLMLLIYFLLNNIMTHKIEKLLRTFYFKVLSKSSQS